MLTPEEQEKLKVFRMSRHSNQAIFGDRMQNLSRKKTPEAQLKRKKSKSDFDKEKRESDKLVWRDENCENPSAA